MKKFLVFTFLAIFSFFLFAFPFRASADLRSDINSMQQDYQLPYSGLLPDHPLYIFKMLRDKIVGILISDPVKKAQFDVLQADKRLSGGVELYLRGQKKELGIETISKGENYFADALAKIEEAKKQGMPLEDVDKKTQLSLKTHLEILKKMEKQAVGEEKTKIVFERKKIEDFLKKVKPQLPQK